ncbi:Tetratricopeptide repeat protein 28 [Stylophora pistillata]|uniref:Tetratricopeptide repeat protein 28 n=1 Tax=Stylophora pistillata TaxID=50429 RepID=A0A2B4RHG0_STYPI|nr:Tetratricopeptide repeat protein 28 [Stylophora pistillata]
MSDAAEILRPVHIGLDVAIFLFNTDRGSQATDLCNESAILLQNLDFGIHLPIPDVLFNAKCAISGITNAERYAEELLYKFHLAGELTMQLGDKYEAQSQFVYAKQLFKNALTIMQSIGHKREDAMVHGRLGIVLRSLSDMQKAKRHHQKALAIAIEIGDRQREGASYGNPAEIGDKRRQVADYASLGSVLVSLGETGKAKEYQEKALAIAIEIGDRKGEGRSNGNLGTVFAFDGEYQKAKEYHEKALAIAIKTGNKHEEGRIKRNLGEVFASLSDYQKAKEYQEKALAIAIEIGDR